MEDFITNPHEREVCAKCRFEYLQSEFCRACFIDVHVVDKSYSWFGNEEFRKFGIYEDINLGELMDYDFRRIVFNAISKIEKDLE